MDTLAWSGKLPGALKGDDDLVKICHDISADILKGDIKLVTFVEMLGPALTNEDAVVRERGINSLVKVLKQLPKIFLKEDELNFILTFFIDRLKDHYSVVPAVLQGILCILEMQNLSSIFPAHLLTEMSKHINCQTQSQNDRFTIYNIIYQLAGKYPQDLKMLGPDFIYQVISSIDGERDPRNLMFLFQIMPGFLRSFPLGHLTEEMFEVLSCYFPVDFYSASNNPSAITRDDLAHALAACLTAVPDFAEFCLPLIFEKLDSTRKAAKLDCFYVLEPHHASTSGKELPEESLETNNEGLDTNGNSNNTIEKPMKLPKRRRSKMRVSTERSEIQAAMNELEELNIT